MKVINLSKKIILSPMAGITDSPFRRICKKMGANIVYSEMISVNGIIKNNKKTLDMLRFKKTERPIAIQIFGDEKDKFVSAVKIIEKKYKPDIIDINLGCPAKKVAINSNAGCALMKQPEKIYEIVDAVVKNSHTPISVKIRSGWDEKHINALEVAKLCENAGANAIIFHPRTRTQGYSGAANWNLIKELKKNINIPVIGNGDIKKRDDIKKIFKQTNCDSVAIGRAAIGNPWIFSKKVIINNFEKFKIIKRHINENVKYYGEKRGILNFRIHLSHYLKGLSNCKKIISELYKIDKKNVLIKEIKNFLLNTNK